MAGNIDRIVSEDQAANHEGAPDAGARDLPAPERRLRDPSPQDASDPRKEKTQASSRPLRTPAILVAIIVAAIVGLSLWYLVQPQPLIVQGEADATRADIAARVEGRVAKRPVERGDTVASGAVLYEIANPELVTSLDQAQAAKRVAEAQLANILVGTRREVIAQRKAAVDSAAANLTLAKQNFERTKTLVAEGHSPQQRLDELTDQLQVAERSSEQSKFAYEEAVNGATKEERGIAHAAVAKAQADIDTIKAQAAAYRHSFLDNRPRRRSRPFAVLLD